MSDSSLLQNGSHGEDIIKAPFELFINHCLFVNVSFHGLSFFKPTDPLSRERVMEKEKRYWEWPKQQVRGESFTLSQRFCGEAQTLQVKQR